MPIVECGFVSAPQPQAALLLFGPTIQVDIGFDPAIIAQLSGAPPPPPPPAPATGQGAATSLPALPSLMQNVPALIDTGARESCIDEALAQQLQLPLINQAEREDSTVLTGRLRWSAALPRWRSRESSRPTELDNCEADRQTASPSYSAPIE